MASDKKEEVKADAAEQKQKETRDQTYSEALKKVGVDSGVRGTAEITASVIGWPVDLANAGLGLVGLGSEKPVGGSEHLTDLFNKGYDLYYNGLGYEPPEAETGTEQQVAQDVRDVTLVAAVAVTVGKVFKPAKKLSQAWNSGRNLYARIMGKSTVAAETATGTKTAASAGKVVNGTEQAGAAVAKVVKTADDPLEAAMRSSLDDGLKKTAPSAAKTGVKETLEQTVETGVKAAAAAVPKPSVVLDTVGKVKNYVRSSENGTPLAKLEALQRQVAYQKDIGGSEKLIKAMEKRIGHLETQVGGGKIRKAIANIAAHPIKTTATVASAALLAPPILVKTSPVGAFLAVGADNRFFDGKVADFYVKTYSTVGKAAIGAVAWTGLVTQENAEKAGKAVFDFGKSAVTDGVEGAVKIVEKSAETVDPEATRNLREKWEIYKGQEGGQVSILSLLPGAAGRAARGVEGTADKIGDALHAPVQTAAGEEVPPGETASAENDPLLAGLQHKGDRAKNLFNKASNLSFAATAAMFINMLASFMQFCANRTNSPMLAEWSESLRGLAKSFIEDDLVGQVSKNRMGVPDASEHEGGKRAPAPLPGVMVPAPGV